MARRNTNAAGLSLIKSFESYVPYVYDDLVAGKGGKYPEWTGWKPKGTLTIGFWWEGPGMATPLLEFTAFLVTCTYTFPWSLETRQ